MTHAFRFTAEKVAARLELLRAQVVRRRHPIAPFRLLELPDATTEPPLHADPSGWERIESDTYWGRFDLNFLFRSSFALPEGWDAGSSALYFPLGNAGDIFTHPEALLYIDSEPIASADRYHHTIPLPARFADGAEHQIALHGWTGMSGWPPDPNDRSKLFMRQCCVIERDRPTLDLVRHMEVALDVAKHLNENSASKHRLFSALDRAITVLDTRHPLGEQTRESVAAAAKALEQGLNAAGEPLGVTLHAIGHAHMDIAYLWPIEQIRRKNARTYSNVLRLMEAGPDYRFSHSQPQLYEFTERDHPEIFRGIERAVADGRWEVMGGMWVEPDVNLAGAESLARQLLYGRTYFRGKFGDVETPVLWLPDTFGFPASLPQLMRQAGLKWFVTNKLGWNQYNPMPCQTFTWEGLDGSAVTAQLLTTPRSVRYLPFPTNYKSDLSAAEVFGTWETYKHKERNWDLPICYGYGDGGGGPTEELIARADALHAMPGAPRVKKGTVRGFFEALESQPRDLPRWRGELYMEGHRGVFTSQGWIKRANRRAEAALAKAEFLVVLANVHAGHEHDRASLRRAWELTLLNQFHDILPGTSIGRVFEEARDQYAEVMERANAVSTAAIGALSPVLPSITTHALVNPSPFAQSGPVEIEGVTGAALDAATGAELPTQAVAGSLLIDAGETPAYSVRGLRIGAGEAATPPEPDMAVEVVEEAGAIILRNPLLSITIDDRGTLRRVRDREAARDVLAPGANGNQLQVFEDRPIGWDAWDIDAFYDDRPDLVTDLRSMEIVERGPLRAAVRIVRCHGASRIVQTIRLGNRSKRIDFATEIDWHAHHTLLKAAFPVEVSAGHATYDIQWGNVARPTHRNTPFDQARFEVPAHKWADLSEGDYGVALLNDCKYGYDVESNVLRLSLLKSATMPDPEADQGKHRFTYSLLPHVGGWRGTVPAEAYALNRPLEAIPARGTEAGDPVLSLVALEAGEAIIETVKPAENGRGYIIRLYDNNRTRGERRLGFAHTPGRIVECDLLENDRDALPLNSAQCDVHLRPYEIRTLRVGT